MQQHHTRQSHMRLPPHTNNIQIHPTPMLPGQPPTQPQQHLNIPPPQATVAAGAQSNQHNMQQAAMSNAPPQMRDQALNRANNHKHMPATNAIHHNQTAQMQKIRQQHQNLNHKTNNNNVNNKSQFGNHINMQQQQNNALQTHNMGTLHPQQHQQTTLRNVPNIHGQQPQYNTLPMKNHAPPPTALRQILPANATRTHQHQQMQQQQQQYGYNYSGNKPKYNTNTNNTDSSATKSASATFSTPKAILQNPNRLTKSATTTTQTPLVRSNKKEAKTNHSNVANEEDDNSTSDSAAAEPTVSNAKAADSENFSAPTESSEISLQKVDSNEEANKENVSESNECNNFSNNKILCNDDSIAKNAKEKTPMCLVNELARYNKISHQYRLTGEKGPAHSKRFTVTLKLGTEEYTAEGFKIKKAQHSAASLALEKTSYKHPIPKAIRNHDDSKPRPYIMPTVELNALAMKLGQQTYYLYDPRQMPPPIGAADMNEHVLHDANLPTQHYNGGVRGLPVPINGTGHLMPLPPQQRLLNESSTYGHGPRRNFDGGFCGAPVPPPPPPAHISNCPPQRPFGPPHRGGFPMMNRYQRYPMIPPTPPPPPGMPHMHHPHYSMIPTTPYKITLIVGKQKFVGVGRTLQHAKHDAASRALQVLKAQQLEEHKEELEESMDENDVKSPISQVHEAGIKRNLTVHFKIIREEGPAHMRNFITACIMGSMVTEGEGHGKKISKKRAAEKMLLEIQKLPPVCTPQKSPSKRSKGKTPSKLEGKDAAESGEREVRSKRDKFTTKEKAKKLHEEKVAENDECPITKLLQLMQQRKQKEPVFEYIAKSGSDRVKKREFIVEVTAQGYAARGTGANKKIAKRNAAENLLHTLLEEENSSSDNDATEEHIELDDETAEFEATNNQSSPIVVKNSVKETKNLKSPKSLEDLNLPTASIAGPVPGILILRQNRKTTTSKRKENPATTSSTPARPVKAIAKRIETDSNEPNTVLTPARPVKTAAKRIEVDLQEPSTASANSPNENSKPVKQSVKIVTPAEENAETDRQSPIETAISATTTDTSKEPTSTPTATTANDNNTSTAVTGAAAEKPTTSNSNTSSTSTGAPSMMKQQLLYLANLLGFEVNFSDYPKGNHNEFLTIVALSTDPPQMCHGFGQDTNESQNDAARNALKILSDLGLNNAKSN